MFVPQPTSLRGGPVRRGLRHSKSSLQTRSGSDEVERTARAKYSPVPVAHQLGGHRSASAEPLGLTRTDSGGPAPFDDAARE